MNNLLVGEKQKNKNKKLKTDKIHSGEKNNKQESISKIGKIYTKQSRIHSQARKI
jgi:hypothetical protein